MNYKFIPVLSRMIKKFNVLLDGHPELAFPISVDKPKMAVLLRYRNSATSWAVP
jgi:hypothetical protein